MDRLEKLKPHMSLDHLVRERYPTFADALSDLDDALTLLHLFALLRSGTTNHHTADISSECNRLVREFQSYIAREHALKKVFISVKGVYFQAEVHGKVRLVASAAF